MSLYVPAYLKHVTENLSFLHHLCLQQCLLCIFFCAGHSSRHWMQCGKETCILALTELPVTSKSLNKS